VVVTKDARVRTVGVGLVVLLQAALERDMIAFPIALVGSRIAVVESEVAEVEVVWTDRTADRSGAVAIRRDVRASIVMKGFTAAIRLG
jgi:hypothetical protein